MLAGMVHGAMYDAVASVLGGLEPFATAVRGPGGRLGRRSGRASSPRCARRPRPWTGGERAGRVRRVHGGDPGRSGEDRRQGRRRGRRGRDARLRTGDHFDDVVPYVQQAPGPGVFEPIAPTTPVDTKLPYVRCPSRTADTRLPAGRALPGDLAEQPAVRARTSPSYRRSGRHRVLAHPGSRPRRALLPHAPTYVQYSRALRALVERSGLDLRESARLLGYTWVATGDTMIACWEAKYHYRFWRPNHAIQRADTDGNPATTPDPTWLPLVTGNHPEYPSGHACFTAGRDEVAAGVLRHGNGADAHGARAPLTGTARTYTGSASSSRTSRTLASGAASTTARR